jgi:feruloyl esterase
MWIVAAIAIGLIAFAPAAGASDAARCRSLPAEDFGQVPDAPSRVTGTAVIAASGAVPAHCKVEGYAAPQVGFEFHLPIGSWNGKFVMQGCGAMCGSLQGLASCPDALARGYACGTTDMGHRAPSNDGKWAYANPMAEIDLGHRATHVATVAGKAIIAAFYGSEIKRSYFRGCSTGGRQALVEAQRYPYDFDGVIAGASVLYAPMGPPLQLPWDVLANLDRDGKPIMSESKLPIIADAVMKACDAIDGLADGMITDPRQCKFDLKTLACSGASSGQCLTDAEMTVVRKFYDGPRNAKGPLPRIGGQPFGTERLWGGFMKGRGSDQYHFASENLRYLGFALDPGPTYDVMQFDWDRDPQRLSYSHLTAANPDLGLFADNGGKMILFHGWSDAAIPATTSINYYELVTRTMGGLAETQRFARLYLLPGLGHCRGGGVNFADFLGALDRWVETGTAPEELTGLSFADNGIGPINAPADFRGDLGALRPALARPLFPYPDQAQYRRGDPAQATSFRRVRGPSGVK